MTGASSVRPSVAPPVALHALFVGFADDVAAMARASLEPAGDRVSVARDLGAAVSLPPRDFDVAFVDVSLPGGTALAVVHHLVGGAPRCAVYTVAHVTELAQAAEALSLGAKGLLVAPLTGDAILQAAAEVRAARATRTRIAQLEAARDALEEERDVLARAVRVARAGDARAMAETIAGLVTVATGARGVAVFGPEERDRGRRRLAAFGAALDLRDGYAEDDLARAAAARGAAVHILTAEDRALGAVLVEGARPSAAPRLAEICDLGATLLLLADAARASLEELPTMPRSRGLALSTFERLLEREIDAARAESRAVQLLCVLPEAGSAVDLARLSAPLAEPGSLCGAGGAGEAYVLLPKTDMPTARALLRAVPQRTAGLASFPADAGTAPRLLRVAELRAKEAWRSPVAQHGLHAMSLGEIVRTLAFAPVLESRLTSAFPLELAPEAARSIVEHACRQAARGSAQVRVHAAGAAPFDLAAAARDVVGGERVTSHATTGAPDCAGVVALVVLSDLGSWSLCGRLDGPHLRAVHSADPSLAVVLADRLERVARLSKPPPGKAGS